MTGSWEESCFGANHLTISRKKAGAPDCLLLFPLERSQYTFYCPCVHGPPHGAFSFMLVQVTP